VVGGESDRDGRVDARELLDCDRVRHGVCTGAAVLLRDRHSHQPERRQLADELVGEASLAVELFGNRRDTLLREVAHRRANELMLLFEVEVQPDYVVNCLHNSTISRTP
jgi:hypothetical protein